MAPLLDDEAKLVDRIADAVVARRLSLPAVLFLESTKPLAFLGSQALHFFAPMACVVVSQPVYRAATGLLEDRDKVEALLQRIEEREQARSERRSP